ncbi:endo-1,4-beta-xylanase D [Asticcacaulis biprosthecium C19]|uniref:Endo-1,4-beta-xylanase D n=1 Tax=Asticcacaulis biprosthecium C19 TaxID=715226 RepID=F4QH77_9CAUL|nr:glycoside hydrolase family 43 protein [Asticcacaulis biprosthecium]EGF92614.1 endo-1,4-beta-xylanase D [Asticcacaulis biprosthecium C19]
MAIKPAALICALLAMCLPAGLARADNPVIQTRFTADPAPLVHDGVVYLYVGHDEDDAAGFKMLDWRLYSSTDMANWTDRGVVASLKTFPWAVQANDAWAPQVIARDGKFYLYAPISVAGSPKNVIAVAVADNPAGPFKDALGKPLIGPIEGYIDPTVWIDDDGQAYLYWGNPHLWYVKLNKDMVSYSGPIVQVDSKPADYQEGPWFYKRNDHYYMAYASTCCPEGIGYAMSETATGPWVHKGKVMDPNPGATGNHPGIVDYKGKSYVFGFNYELNFAMTPIHHERRSVTMTEFRYNPDGTIPNQPWWDTKGAAQIEPVDPYRRVEAETIAWTSRIKRDRDRPYAWAPGVTTAQDDAKGVYVTRIADRTYIKVAGVDFGKTPAKAFVASVAGGAPGATIELRLDRIDGPVMGVLQVGPVGDAGQWREETVDVTGATGVRDLFMIFRGRGAESLFDVDYWRFEH